MFLGIDLGTSNSAIVGNRAGRLDLYKAASGEDILPSVVMLDRAGSRYVGRRAYEQLRVAPQGVAARFKRLLGTNTVLPFGPGDGTITPEEASAEVLRQLLKQMRSQVPEDAIAGAIVTVPAAFNQMQSEATIRAANAAGLDQVGLLQEPIAAAMACMEKPDARDGLFLVYDLGGGTFDVALVRAIGGAVTVEAHEGINMLGGSDFDRMILDEVVMPWLAKQFAIPAEPSKSPALQRLLALAKAHVERAKIELSSMEETVIFVSEDEARVEDSQGAPIYLEVPLTRGEVERIVCPRIDRSLELCRKILADNGYGAQDVSKVVLIGGPSRMPVVRNRVPGELGIEADLDIDPMTAVARGAAIYAESREWAAPGTTGGAAAGSKRARVKLAAGDLVSYDFEARTTKDRGRIRVVASGEALGWRVQARDGSGRDYGERALAEAPIFAIELGAGETTVTMAVTDDSGAAVEEASSTLVLTRVAAAATGAPCTATISVKVEDTDGTRSINMLEPLLAKGDTLPRTGQRTFRAARKLVPGGDDWIDVELYEQAEDVPEPEANLLIGAFRLSAKDLPLHVAPLMPGDAVVLHWSVDDNQLIRASVELPGCGLHLTDHSFYVDDLARIDFGADGRQFAREALLAAHQDFLLLMENAGEVFARETAQIQARMEEQYERLETAYEADVFRSITEESRLIRQEISRLRHKPQAQATALEAEFYETQQRLRRLWASLGEARVAEGQAHLATARRALDEAQFQVCKRALSAANDLCTRSVVSQPGFIAALYRQVRSERHAAIDKVRFDQLVALGDAALAANREDDLRPILTDLRAIMTDAGGATTDAAALAGLRR